MPRILINSLLYFIIIIYKIMWNSCTLQDLKTQSLKSKSYKCNNKDLQNYMLIFQRYFVTYRYAANCQKVIQYFVEIFVATLHVTNNEKIYQTFKKLVHWLNQDPNCKAAYYLIKAVVQICERQFPQIHVKQDSKKKKQQNKDKDKDKDKDNKQKQKQRDKSRDRQTNRSQDKKQKQQQSPQTIKNNLKLVLSLVRKSGDKNMLIQDVYQVFIQYYLQRISKQIQDYNKNITTKQKQKSISLGSTVLTSLSSLLAARNKTQVANVARQHIQQSTGNNISSYIGVYLLLQLTNISQLLSSALTPKPTSNSSTMRQQQDKLMYPKTLQQTFLTYLQQSQQNKLPTFLINKLLHLLCYCIDNKNYKLLHNLYKLYPMQLQNNEQLIDRLYIHIVLETQQIQLKVINIIDKNRNKWQDQYIQQHMQYIQSTSIKKYNNDSNKNIMNLRYVIKLYYLTLAMSNQQIQANQQTTITTHTNNIHITIDKGIKKMLDIIVKYTTNTTVDQITQFVNKIYKISEDCQGVIVQYRNRNKNKDNNNININTNNNTNTNTNTNIDNIKQMVIHNNQRYNKHVEQLRQIKQQIVKIIQNYNKIDKQQYTDVIKDKIKLKQQNKNTLFQSWKIVLQALFQLNMVTKQKSNQNQYQQYYNKQAISALSYLSLRPSLLPKPKSTSPSYFQVTPLSKTSVQILSLIISQIDKQQIVSHIKKIMLDIFDKVDQSIIRDIIVYNLFYSKCLLMTNHIPKCKFMMELMVRECQQPGRKYLQIQKQQYLGLLLPAIPQVLLFDYCRYVANRDKLQMRLAMFEKQCIGFQGILDANLYDVAVKNKIKTGNNGLDMPEQ